MEPKILYLNRLLVCVDEFVLLHFAGIQEHKTTHITFVFPLVHLVGGALVTIQRLPK